MRRRLTIVATLAATVLILKALGLATPWTSPDTAGWLHPCADGGCLGGPRTPLYAWMTENGSRPGLIVTMQFLCILASALLLHDGMTAAGAGSSTALAAGLAVATSNVTILWTHALLPEAFAHAALITAFALCLLRLPLAAGGLLGLACLLKPAFLPFVVTLPAFHIATRGLNGVMRLLAGMVMVLGPFVALRFNLTGDANIVSFGGFQSSGIAALMLTPEIAHHLPADVQPMAAEIIRRRTALIAAGVALPLPLDSHGTRSFLSAALGYPDILARSYDAILYGAVQPIRQAGESWVGFDNRLQRLTLHVILIRPNLYVAWIVGGLARVLGRIALFNPAFVLATILCLLRRPSPSWPTRDRVLLTALCGAWLAATVAPAIMLSFPAARYIDSAGLPLAILPLRALLGGRDRPRLMAPIRAALRPPTISPAHAE